MVERRDRLALEGAQHIEDNFNEILSNCTDASQSEATQ